VLVLRQESETFAAHGESGQDYLFMLQAVRTEEQSAVQRDSERLRGRQDLQEQILQRCDVQRLAQARRAQTCSSCHFLPCNDLQARVQIARL